MLNIKDTKFALVKTWEFFWPQLYNDFTVAALKSNEPVYSQVSYISSGIDNWAYGALLSENCWNWIWKKKEKKKKER